MLSLSPSIGGFPTSFFFAVTQLSPNAIADLLAFSAWCRWCLVPESVPLFLQYFHCVRISKEPGHYFFRHKQNADHLFGGAVNKWEDWKKHYYFIRSGCLEKPLNLPSRWKSLDNKINKTTKMDELHKYMKRLRHPHLPLDATILCSPKVLSYRGVSPFNMSLDKLATCTLIMLSTLSCNSLLILTYIPLYQNKSEPPSALSQS